MSLDARLAKLGVTEDELADLMLVFGPKFSKHQFLKYDEKLDTMDPKRWRGGGGSLHILEEFADHFLHRRRVLNSTRVFKGRCRWEDEEGKEDSFYFDIPHTAQLVLDLDVHSVEQLMTIEDRYRAARELFRPTPLVFRSSRSGGVHVVWFLRDLVPVEELFTLTRRVLKRGGHSLSADAGVEIFPTPSAEPLRIPLGAHGALLDPETLLPVELPFREVYRLIVHAWNGAVPFEDLFHSDVLKNLPEDDCVDDDTPSTGQSDFSRSSQRDPLLERRIWEQGLSPEHNRQKAVPYAIRHAFFVLNHREKEALVAAVQQWLESKHNDLSNGYFTDRKTVFEDIAARVKAHLAWEAEHPCRFRKEDPTQRLTTADYVAVIKMEPKVQKVMASTGLDVTLCLLRVGLAELLLYVKRHCGPGLTTPTIPIPAIRMRSLQGWGRNKDPGNYYKKWLEALSKAEILVVADSIFTPGGGKGECCTYTLYHSFGEGDPIEGHQRGFDEVLGVGKVPVPARRAKRSTAKPVQRKKRKVIKRGPDRRLLKLKGPGHAVPLERRGSKCELDS